MHKNYTYPNPVKVRTLDILFYYQEKDSNSIIYNKSLCVDFDLSRSDASNRLSKLRNWGLLKFNNKAAKGYDGYILTDRGKSFKRLNE